MVVQCFSSVFMNLHILTPVSPEAMGATEATVDEASLAQDVASVLGRLGSWESWESSES